MRTILAMAAAMVSSAWAQQIDSPKVAALIGLSPSQSYVHVFCDKGEDLGDCAVTFRCQGYFESVTWAVDVPPGLFKYWPGQTDGAGDKLDLETALVDAGLSARDARHRTSCAVHSFDPVDVQAFSYLAGNLVPMSNQVLVGADPDALPPVPEPPPPEPPAPAPGVVPKLEWEALSASRCRSSQQCRYGYGARLAWFWDARHHGRVFIYRGTSRNFGAATHILNSALFDTPNSRQSQWRYLTVYEDRTVRAGTTYYYWLVAESPFQGRARSEPAGPAGVRTPAQ